MILRYKDEFDLESTEFRKKINNLNSKINLLEKEVEALDIKRNKKEIKMTEYSKIAHPLKVELNYAKNDKMKEEDNLKIFVFSANSEISKLNKNFSDNLKEEEKRVTYNLNSTKERLDKLNNKAYKTNAINKSLKELKGLDLVVQFILTADKKDFFPYNQLQIFKFKDGKQFSTSNFPYGTYESILISAYRNDFFKIVRYDTSYFEGRK